MAEFEDFISDAKRAKSRSRDEIARRSAASAESKKVWENTFENEIESIFSLVKYNMRPRGYAVRKTINNSFGIVNSSKVMVARDAYFDSDHGFSLNNTYLISISPLVSHGDIGLSKIYDKFEIDHEKCIINGYQSYLLDEIADEYVLKKNLNTAADGSLISWSILINKGDLLKYLARYYEFSELNKKNKPNGEKMHKADRRLRNESDGGEFPIINMKTIAISIIVMLMALKFIL